jgi:methanogenic corrinoid protein MtbC1
MLDLGRERHNTEQLQKSLDAQNDAHKELVETLKKAQSTIVEELTKEGSFLANIINSESTIQMK